MDDIRRCHDPGPYDGRCANAYGSPSPRFDRETRRVKEIITSVRSRVAPSVPRPGRRSRPTPFPCGDPLFDQLATTTTEWQLSVARAQVPTITTSVQRICNRLRVGAEELAAQTTEITDKIDLSDAALIAAGTDRRTQVLRLRAMLAP
jgi:hypothetical protein